MICFRELPEALCEYILRFLELIAIGQHVVAELLDERVAEPQPIARLPLAVIHHLKMRDPKRPAVETRAGLELVEFPPEHERRLLQPIVRVRARKHQRADERKNARLAAQKQPHELFMTRVLGHGRMQGDIARARESLRAK
ncbi:MAG: hypothetical protein Q7S40_21825 [Opitutaceae bacterium]|nr:hypothetical protein [Opitutaceae bacterium]